MEVFAEYLARIDDLQQRGRTEEVLEWVGRTYSELEPRVAWNQPMFTCQGTFIIGFSVSAKHLAVSPEQAGMERFSQEIAKAGYGQSRMLFRIQWSEAVNYPLLRRMIEFNLAEKAGCKTFWRK